MRCSRPPVLGALLLLIVPLLVPNVGCATYGLSSIARSEAQAHQSHVKVPGKVVDDSLAGTTLEINSSPITNLDVRAYYPDGTPKFTMTRDRAVVIDAWGNEVVNIEGQRAANFNAAVSTLSSAATQLATVAQGYQAFMWANRPAPPDSGDPSFSQQLQQELLATMRQVRDKLNE